MLFTKFNAKGITDLDVKRKTIKLLEGNVRETLDDLGFGDDTTPKAPSVRGSTDTLGLVNSNLPALQRKFQMNKDWKKRLQRPT